MKNTWLGTAIMSEPLVFIGRVSKGLVLIQKFKWIQLVYNN